MGSSYETSQVRTWRDYIDMEIEGEENLFALVCYRIYSCDFLRASSLNISLILDLQFLIFP